jgi:death-on-curing protein
LLESACARPVNHWQYEHEEDVVVLACALLLGIARNHPFLQGNKRTAFEAFIGFLVVNGYRFEILDAEHNADLIVAAIEGAVTEAQFVEAVRPGVVPDLDS